VLWKNTQRVLIFRKFVFPVYAANPVVVGLGKVRRDILSYKLFETMSTVKTAAKAARQEGIPFDENIISSIVINGDLSKLAPQQKVSYYRQFCERLGLDPLSQPFKLLRLNGKEVMYCDRSGTQQLNKLHNVSHEIKARETVNGCYVVTAQASTPEGRRTESIGAVPIDNLKGDALCNAMMKAETKAKRRATLDLLGLGILDESETETIPNAVQLAAPVTAKAVADVPAAPQTAAPATKTASPFKQKYDTVEAVTEILQSAGSVQDIANLYYINAELVERTPELKAAFSGKKNSFYNKQAVPAAPADEAPLAAAA